MNSITEMATWPDNARLIEIDSHWALPRDGITTWEHNAGIAYSRENATIAALGEAVERYSGYVLPREELALSTAAELGERCVAPESFCLFSDEQYGQPDFACLPFTRDRVMFWAEGFRLPDLEPTLIPSQLVYMAPPEPEEDRIAYSTSNGLACATNLADAVLRGLLELIERDAVMLAWRHRLSLPLLDWANVPDLVDEERRYFAPALLEHAVVDLTPLACAPAALAVVRSRHEDLVPIVIGAAAGISMREAWRKALCEAYKARRWVRRIRLQKGARYVPRIEDVNTFVDHALYYAHPDTACFCDFLDASDSRSRIQTLRTCPSSLPPR